MKNYLGTLASIYICLNIVGCIDTSLSSSSSQILLSQPEVYLDSESEIRVFHGATDTNPGTFVTELLVENSRLIIPQSLFNGDFGDRRHSNSLQPLDLIVKVFRPETPSGDFYFEAPLLGSKIDISNVTTAVSWILRWGFKNQNIFISQDQFSSLVSSVEILCNNCRNKTNSDVVDFVMNNIEIKNRILTTIKKSNSDLKDEDFFYDPPSAIYAWSSPNITADGFVYKELQETQSTQIKIALLNPKISYSKINPNGWIRIFNQQEHTSSTSVFQYEFSYDDKGNHTIKPFFSNLDILSDLSFIYTITDKNRKPFCNENITVQMYANRLNEIPLASYCSDLDIEDTNLTYNLNSGPPGLTVSSSGLVRWTPSQASDNLGYKKQLLFSVHDDKFGYAEIEITIDVIPDKLPTFTHIPSPIDFQEGLPAQYIFNAEDADGDPLKLVIEPIDSIINDLPAGAGLLTNIIRTGSSGDYSFQWTFIPSWRQIGISTGSAKVRITLYYDPENPILNSGIILNSEVVTINFTNTDDPPIWTVTPTEQNLTENISANMIYLGTAIDPSPNPTAITYSASPSGDINCSWLKDDGYIVTYEGSAYLNQAPPFNSSSECSLSIIARDEQGLTTNSQEFSIQINDVNRAVTTKDTAPSFYSITEMQTLRIELSDIFDDPDFNEQDPLEQVYAMSCLWDDNLDGNYDKPCSQNPQGVINFTVNSMWFYSTWTPDYTAAGTYNIQLTVTDKGGSSATHRITLEVEQAPAKMTLSAALTSTNSPISELSVEENTTTQITLKARSASNDAIDIYNINLKPTVCVIIGNGTCDPSMITLVSSNLGYGNSDFVFNIKTDFDDGDALLPGNFKSYTLRFYIEKSDNSQIYSDFILPLTVTNKNRPPSGIGMTNGSNGCIGSSNNSSLEDFVICIDVSRDNKIGNSWSKLYTSELSAVDPDATIDQFTFEFMNPSIVPGDLENTTWSFKIPNCISKANSTVYRYFNIKVSDGRGGTIQRNVTLKFLRAQANGICMQ